ncbi:MAG TPA: carbamoyltransferase HypF [Micromonosporaceae bacterium]
MNDAIRLRVRVEGIVQGVGFRPFVHAVAHRLALGGHVGNDVDGVFIEVEGAVDAVEEFLAALRIEPPPLATIDAIVTTALPPTGTRGFVIVDSDGGGERRTGVSADSATCTDCLAELADPADRRYRYPFINCTNCGPRYSIVRDVPYDRPYTTMASFTMCDACSAEYHDPADRRFHAQPVCCAACGPTLTFDGGRDDPIGRAARLLTDGGVLAIKGLGGFHLAADAASEAATGALRARKHREDKPFAVMVADLDQARELCVIGDAAAALLADRRRPIVLLPRRAGVAAWGRLAQPVAPGNHDVGLMLPYTPIHHLLLDALAGPIVLTSGNVSDEPIAYADDDAAERLGGIADAYLTHDRPIHTRVDDSVARIGRGRPMLLRRARGYAPEPVRLSTSAARPILACGAELKNTFCLLKGDRAILSQHIGDLENYATMRSYASGVDHLSRLFDVKPEIIAYDLHPEYLSTKYALDRADAESLELVGVQHHHAHIASCLADNGYMAGPVIGVAYDGTGYGADGTLWGGEFLLADLRTFERVGHLAPVPLAGGAAAIRQPWRMAATYLDAAYDGSPPSLAVLNRHAETWPAIVSMGHRGLNAPPTSSVGRLFDALAAVLGIRDEINYEGQAAIELEQRADRYETGAYPAAISADGGIVRGADLVRGAAEDLSAGTAVGTIAARFHNGLVAVTARMCAGIRERSGVATVALSGGVFQNVLLAGRLTDELERAGFAVLTHSRVPPNDGGISLGQAAVAAALDRQPG